MASDQYWEEKLTPAQYKVLRQKSTELPFTGEYNLTMKDGEYRCAACGALLFTSKDKFLSACGWPSFSDPAVEKNVKFVKDTSFGMKRIEVVCSRCGGHLGHYFEDGPKGRRYCINSASLDFKAEE